MPVQYPPSGLLTQRQEPGYFEKQKQREQQQQLLRLKLEEMRSQIGLRQAQTSQAQAAARPKPPTASEQAANAFIRIIDEAFKENRIDFQTWLALRSGAKGKFPATGAERAQAEATLAKTRKETGLLGKPKPVSELERKDILSQIKTREAPKDLSINKLVARLMQTLPPGSPKWLELAKITSGGITVNLPSAQKSTIAKMEQAVLDSRKSVLGLDIIDKTFKPEYTEYPFQLQATLTRTIEKFGKKLPTKSGGLLLTGKQLGDYAAWVRQAEEAFLTFRKWATGVAGGEREMAAIREAFATKDKSATEFKAMVKQAKMFQQAYMAELDRLIRTGSVLNKNTQTKAAQIGMKAAGIQPGRQIKSKQPNMPISQDGPSFTNEEAIAELKRRGTLK